MLSNLDVTQRKFEKLQKTARWGMKKKTTDKLPNKFHQFYQILQSTIKTKY